MTESHVFTITSLKDLTSNVAVEAISLGLPVVCLDHCGFSDLVTDDCGIKVYVGTEEQIISDMASALRRLFEDEPLRWKMTTGALRRCQQYSWANKMSDLDRVYANVMQARESAYAGS